MRIICLSLILAVLILQTNYTSRRTKPTEHKCVYSSSVKFSSIKTGNRRIIRLNTKFVDNDE